MTTLVQRTSDAQPCFLYPSTLQGPQGEHICFTQVCDVCSVTHGVRLSAMEYMVQHGKHRTRVVQEDVALLLLDTVLLRGEQVLHHALHTSSMWWNKRFPCKNILPGYLVGPKIQFVKDHVETSPVRIQCFCACSTQCGNVLLHLARRVCILLVCS